MPPTAHKPFDGSHQSSFSGPALPNELLHMIFCYVLTEYIDEALTLATCEDRHAFDNAVLPPNAFLTLLHVSRKFREIVAHFVYVILGIGREPDGSLAENPNTLVQSQRQEIYHACHGIIPAVATRSHFETPTPHLGAYRILGEVEYSLSCLTSSAEPSAGFACNYFRISVLARCLKCLEVRSDILSRRIGDRAGNSWVRFDLILSLKQLACGAELNNALDMLSGPDGPYSLDVSPEDELGTLMSSLVESTAECVDSFLDQLENLEYRYSPSTVKAVKTFGLRIEDIKITRDIAERSGTISFLEKVLDADLLVDKLDLGVRAHALLMQWQDS